MKAIEKKYALPFALVTSLFLLWGLANNMTDTLLAAFKRIMDMSDTQTSMIQLAFYGAYFCLALPAALFIRKYSYKSGVILGLGLYACGALLFLPAAKAASYAFYLVAIYIMAGGCSVLETTANPYIMAMGTPETATRRLNIAQSFNPIGSILGILMSKFFILRDISLYSVSGTYMSLGLVLVAILVFMLFARMPEGKDSADDSVSASFRRLAKNRDYIFGVVAQFFYVGAQICVWSYTIRIVMKELGILEAQAATVYLLTIIGFCASRFVYTWLMGFYSPAKLLRFGSVMSIICCSLVIVLGARSGEAGSLAADFGSVAGGMVDTGAVSAVASAGAGFGWATVISLMLISVFMSLMFPTIYGMALSDVEIPERGGHPGDAKIGASGLIMAILGGALLPPLQGMLSDAFGINVSYCIPLVCFVIVLIYAQICLNGKIFQS